jgi:hypothetical protein
MHALSPVGRDSKVRRSKKFIGECALQFVGTFLEMSFPDMNLAYNRAYGVCGCMGIIVEI